MFAVFPAGGAVDEKTFRPVRDYRLEMELNVTAPLEFLSRFGAVQLIVYPQGIRADAFGVTALTLSGSRTVRIANPTVRLFVDVPIDELGATVLKLAGQKDGELLPNLRSLSVTKMGRGTVKEVPANRYRLVISRDTSIDLWMTSAIPRNEHLHRIGMEMLGAISTNAVKAVSGLPGTLLYVELNSPNFKKVCLLRLKTLTRSSAGFEDELRLSGYLEAPLVDRLWD